MLLAAVIGAKHEWLLTHGDTAIPARDAARFRLLCERRRSGVPIAYLLGAAHFYGREFLVDENVLVPRPETEHVVEEAIAFIRGPMRVLDIGTGSGAIACTIAAETNASVDATDVSRAAIELATENARRLGVSQRCEFFEGDLMEPVRHNRYDVIVANLPYLPTADVPKPPDPVSFEPRLATDGGPDGLALYRRLIPALPELMNEGGLILLECAPPTFEPLKELLQLSLPYFTISVGQDYSGLARYVKAVDAASSGLRSASAASESARNHGGWEGRESSAAERRTGSANVRGSGA